MVSWFDPQFLTIWHILGCSIVFHLFQQMRLQNWPFKNRCEQLLMKLLFDLLRDSVTNWEIFWPKQNSLIFWNFLRIILKACLAHFHFWSKHTLFQSSDFCLKIYFKRLKFTFRHFWIFTAKLNSWKLKKCLKNPEKFKPKKEKIEKNWTFATVCNAFWSSHHSLNFQLLAIDCLLRKVLFLQKSIA